ncbi:MAG: aromatic ring-hydroxylating dioxygenase subunit alpha [Gammaproteobacteria bacterium]|nr:aromatic ring-hydroxylating dioxygenase subunit alpha [Gammaproteobacteria bacterium]
MDRQLRNQNTQPLPPMKIFNNFDVVVRGWYFACKSQDIKKKRILSLVLCNQQIVIFRGEDGVPRALDAFCPHMGTDLGIGSVEGNHIRCFFHKWAFDGAGKCVDIPCLPKPLSNVKLRSYACREQYGFIWVFPDDIADFELPTHDELENKALLFIAGKSYIRTCHHHVTMINGIDKQHLKTVHGVNIEMQLEYSENEHEANFSLKGNIPTENFTGRLLKKMFGATYEYSMKYSAGTIGLLSTMKGLFLLGKLNYQLPEANMIFAYRPLENQCVEVQPIYVTEKRKGILGFFINHFLLSVAWLGFCWLKAEDGKVYENMRFNPQRLLPMDQPIATFIAFINKLSPSIWSKPKAPTTIAEPVL